MNYLKNLAFTLMELLVTIAIIGVLAAIAVPSYLSYTSKAAFNELVQATAPYKASVAVCYQQQSSFSGCDAGSNGIPPAITTTVGRIATLAVSSGVITVTPANQNGLTNADTYILTPTASSDGTLTWVASGGGVTAGYSK